MEGHREQGKLFQSFFDFCLVQAMILHLPSLKTNVVQFYYDKAQWFGVLFGSMYNQAFGAVIRRSLGRSR